MKCVWCGGAVPPRPVGQAGRRRSYCSDACRSSAQWARSNSGRTKPLDERECLWCKEPFRPRQESHTCCSKACNKKLNNETRRGARGPDYYRKLFVAERGGRCQHCGGGEDLQVHHIISVAEGGPHTPENVLVLCRACHLGEHKTRPKRGLRSPEGRVATSAPREVTVENVERVVREVKPRARAWGGVGSRPPVPKRSK